MPLPYRKPPQNAVSPCAAYIDVLWVPSTRTFYGALLIIDGAGQPLELVHNTLSAPAGFLWPERQVRDLGVASLCRSLFDACRREPDLLVCRASLGSPAYCKAEIAPAIPFAQVVEPNGADRPSWSWINDPPSPAMSAYSLGETLRARGFAVEPFSRIASGLREVYPQVPWSEVGFDPGNPAA